MTESRIEPGGELHDGEPTLPRPAATVLVLRGGKRTLEVLMVQRSPQARFMGGAWVFPGGAVDPEDGEADAGVRTAALRELREETGLTLPGPEALSAYARWITPKEIRVRFDTWFFLAGAPQNPTITLSEAELVDHRWITPADALAAREHGEMLLVFPTIKTLQGLLAFESAAQALAAKPVVAPVEPRVVGSGAEAHVTIPGDPDYPAD